MAGHGTASRYNNGCRCDECRAGRARVNYQWRRQRDPNNQPEDTHGTLNGYVNWSCRCERCREARHDYYQTHRDRRRDA